MPTAVSTRLARLGDAGRKKARPAFFGSIHGTLNHIVIGDRIWLARFAGEEVSSTNLDAILHEDFDELRGARASEDERIETFASCLGKEFLGGRIRHVNNEGKLYVDPVDLLVAHLFNYQTHHQGQVHECSRRRTCRRRSWTCTAS